LAGALIRWAWHLEAAGMMMRFGVAYLFVDRTLCSGSFIFGPELRASFFAFRGLPISSRAAGGLSIRGLP
jgi:hypothetical protein